MSDEPASPTPDDLLGPLAAWVGTWRGSGRGDFPTIDAFDFTEEVVFAATGKPVLAYQQRTRAADGRPLHAESGYIRLVGASSPNNDRLAEEDARVDDGFLDNSRQRVVEWVIAQPTGLVEAAVGTLVDDVLEVRATPGRTPTAVVVTDVRRRYHRDGDELAYDLWMATEDVPTTTHHLAVMLERVED